MVILVNMSAVYTWPCVTATDFMHQSLDIINRMAKQIPSFEEMCPQDFVGSKRVSENSARSHVGISTQTLQECVEKVESRRTARRAEKPEGGLPDKPQPMQPRLHGCGCFGLGARKGVNRTGRGPQEDA